MKNSIRNDVRDRIRKRDENIRAKVLETVTICRDSSADISDLSFHDDLMTQLNFVADLSIAQKKNTGIYHCLVSLILYKIIHPRQNIRKYTVHNRGGFSGRNFEKKYVLEALTSMGLALRSDSTFLTRSIVNIKNSKIKGGENLRMAFLNIMDAIQDQPEIHRPVLRFLFNKVVADKQENRINIERPKFGGSGKILDFVKEQMFFDYKCKGGARFCEIACLSMMKTIAPQVKKYKDCQFGSLNRPSACDRSSKSSGDIEMHDNGRLVLSIETKLNVPIDPMVVMRAEKKIEKYAPGEYWIISYSKSENNRSCNIESMCERIHNEYGCRVSILDGIDWLRHLLCILDDPADFLKEYLDSIEKDEYLMKVHKDKTNELVLKYFFFESESERFKCA